MQKCHLTEGREETKMEKERKVQKKRNEKESEFTVSELKCFPTETLK